MHSLFVRKIVVTSSITPLVPLSFSIENASRHEADMLIKRALVAVSAHVEVK